MRRSGRRMGRRSIGFWLFVLVVIVLLLGLLFGGYRKGTKVGLEQMPVPDSVSAVWTRPAA